jgi:hypothetical protein
METAASCRRHLALGVWGFAPNSENQNAQAFWFGILAGQAALFP